MVEIGVRELKIRATEVVRAVRTRAACYLITYRGNPVAQLVPLEESRPPGPGFFSSEEAHPDRREQAARAVMEIQAIRRKLADWPADLTQSVVTSHQEEA
ncbi:MAG: type II toxin-antitoxin system Phd/YefM family antitoxin [Anaerolineae bacterium]